MSGQKKKNNKKKNHWPYASFLHSGLLKWMKTGPGSAYLPLTYVWGPNLTLCYSRGGGELGDGEGWEVDIIQQDDSTKSL